MTSSTTPAPVAVFVEHVLWVPGSDWDDAVSHLAERFARATPLDRDAVIDAGAFHEQVAELQRWATSASVDLGRELGRWFDEHLSMHVRPKPETTRAVRSLAAVGSVHAATALPERAAEAILRHAGCWRSLECVHADLVDSSAISKLLAELDPRLVVAEAPTPIPDDVDVVSLLSAAV